MGKLIKGGISPHTLLRVSAYPSLRPERCIYLGDSVLEGTVGRLATVPAIRSVPTDSSPDHAAHATATSVVISFSGVHVVHHRTCSSRVTASGDSGGWLRQGIRFFTKDFARVGVGDSVDMSDTNLDFRATTVDYGGVTGFALGCARLGHTVDGFKCFAAKILADAVGGLEDASMMSEM
jgi:hypothetical protein